MSSIPDTGWDIDSNLANDHYLGSSALFDFDVSSDDLNSSQGELVYYHEQCGIISCLGAL